MRAFLVRVSLLIALLLSLVWLCRAPDWEPFLATFTSFCAYVSLDAWKTFCRPSQHDKKLLESFRILLPSDSAAIRFLRDHDVAESFPYDILKPLKSFVHEWDTAEQEFDDRKLEKTRATFYDALQKFLGELAVNTSPSDQRDGYQTMHIRDYEERPEKLQARGELNALGTTAFKAHQELIRMARRRMQNDA